MESKRDEKRFVVDYLAEDEEHIPKHQKICHLRELLRMLKAITGDDRYLEFIDALLDRQREKGEIEMCEILDKYINRGMEKGIEKGRREGMIALVSTLKELGQAYEEVLEKVREKFGLTDAEARTTMENYW